MAAGPADKALDAFKDLVFDPLVKLVIEKIIGLAGFLAWGPIAFIVGKIVVYVADKLYEELGHAINFQYIMLRNESLHKSFVEANSTLKRIAKEKGIDSKEFKDAREKRRKALADFVRHDATRP